jgi:hypothetical protein
VRVASEGFVRCPGGVLKRRLIRGRISEQLRLTACITVSARSQCRSLNVGYEFHVVGIV